MLPDAILDWAKQVRAETNGAFQLNLWISDPQPMRNREHERKVLVFLAQWGPEVPQKAGDASPSDFNAQCEALLNAAPPIVSSVMGLFPPEFLLYLKRQDITWFAKHFHVTKAVPPKLREPTSSLRRAWRLVAIVAVLMPLARNAKWLDSSLFCLP